jgi:hypothetical protein
MRDSAPDLEWGGAWQRRMLKEWRSGRQKEKEEKNSEG